jgi:hypothetical protein
MEIFHWWDAVADFADDFSDRRSESGSVFKVFGSRKHFESEKGTN